MCVLFNAPRPLCDVGCVCSVAGQLADVPTRRTVTSQKVKSSGRRVESHTCQICCGRYVNGTRLSHTTCAFLRLSCWSGRVISSASWPHLVASVVRTSWRYVALVVVLWRPALSASSSSSLASITALRREPVNVHA